MTPATSEPTSSSKEMDPAHPRRRQASVESKAHVLRGQPISWISRPFRAVGRFLTRRLRLVRRGLQILILLEPSHNGIRSSAPVRAQRSEALRRDFAELRRLLGRHSLARRSMPHLDHVEQKLALFGSRGLFNIPVPVLEQALAELDAVEQGLTLDELRARLNSAIEALRYRRAKLKRTHDVEVTEASHSVFSEIERTWTAPMPLADLGHPV